MPAGVGIASGRLFRSRGALRPESIGRFQKFIAELSRFDHEVRCEDDVLSFVAEVRDATDRQARVDRAFPDGVRSRGFEKLVNAELYDYQREGVLFAARAGRCLIGDEMGLGKTIQAIASAKLMSAHLGVSRALIICPTSLKHQWEREISRFTDLSATVINGLRARRQELFQTETFFKITNYDTVHRDLDLITGWSPDLVILDEAQRIKNWKTRAAMTVKRVVSPFAIVLTGTPLENRLEELGSIVEFVDAHRLGPTFRFLAEHQILDEFGKVIGYRNLDTIGKTLQPILIRRRKAEVLSQLPERIDKHFFFPMTPEQMRHHDENRELVALIVARWRRMKFLRESDQRKLMIGLQNMRMSCNSTYLLDQETDFGPKADELATLLGEVLEGPDAKVVVFSQWARTHELIQRRLSARGIGHVFFHGGVPGVRRKALVDRFRDDPACRVFLSTDAGGVGLNLQHASVVVNMDLPWNPAVLEQRIGRVHRMGQKRPVQVFNFVSQGTIEEGMLSVLKFKKSLFTGALDGGEKEVFLGGSRLTRFMETVEKATTRIPAAPPPEPSPEPELSPERVALPKSGPVPESKPLPEAAADVTSLVVAPAAADGQGGQPEQPPALAPDVGEAAPRQAPALPFPSTDNPWAGLLQTGLSFLQQITAHSDGNGDIAAGQAARSVAPLIQKDPVTAEPYLRLPVPSPEVINQLLNAASELISRFRRSS